jgi:DNA polymerase-4
MVIVLDYSDGVRAIRQALASEPTANDFRLIETARLALARAWTRRIRLRRLCLSASRLVFPPGAAGLFPEERQQARREESLLAALDHIREKFGPGAVRRGLTG